MILTDDDDDDTAMETPTIKQENNNNHNNNWKTLADAIILKKEKHNSEESTDSYTQMLADKDQLERILIARKYELGPSVDLVWEQVRFQARWKPDQIQPKDTSTALACKYFVTPDDGE
jgi:hypothetical protein